MGESTGRWSLRWRAIRIASIAALLVVVSTVQTSAEVTTTAAPGSTQPSTTSPSTTTPPPTTSAPSTTASAPTTAPPATTAAPSTTLSPEDREARASAAGNLNAARAADTEILEGLLAINEAAQTTQSEIDGAQRQLEMALRTIDTATAQLEASDEELARIQTQLADTAVEGFMTGLGEPAVFFSDEGVNQTIRQTQLLAQANRSTAELVEELQVLQEDRLVAQAEAEQAAEDAEALEAALTEDLETLREQEQVQLELRAEAQARISRWESELTAYAAEDEAIQELIAAGGSSPVAAPQPREPSSLGFQWPVVGTVTSPYGYRIHPVYGTRKLHSGLDVGAPRGAPIASTSGGLVIFAGWRGGYGNTVIVDHGGGLTSLYAHMSQISVSEGTTVARGDVVGLVGATGTATGNHLHFEIRYDGVATDPAPYLP